jgi:hypothetical protein
MKIIKIESCYDCDAFVQDTSTRGTDHYCAKTGDIFVDSNPATPPLWCPLEDAVECPIYEGPSISSPSSCVATRCNKKWRVVCVSILFTITMV